MQLLDTSFAPAGGAQGIRVSLPELALGSLLELIHAAQQTGVLEVSAACRHGTLPLRLAFLRGEIVDCALLDWRGLDALYSFPQVVESGQAEFWRVPPDAVQAQPPLAPFDSLTMEWARLTDEWPRYIAWIGSPSALLEGPAAPFNRPGGCSVRAAAHMLRQPLHEVASAAVELTRAGLLSPREGAPYAEWQVLTLPRPTFDLARGELRFGRSVLARMDGRTPCLLYTSPSPRD